MGILDTIGSFGKAYGEYDREQHRRKTIDQEMRQREQERLMRQRLMDFQFNQGQADATRREREEERARLADEENQRRYEAEEARRVAGEARDVETHERAGRTATTSAAETRRGRQEDEIKTKARGLADSWIQGEALENPQIGFQVVFAKLKREYPNVDEGTLRTIASDAVKAKVDRTRAQSQEDIGAAYDESRTEKNRQGGGFEEFLRNQGITPSGVVSGQSLVGDMKSPFPQLTDEEYRKPQ